MYSVLLYTALEVHGKKYVFYMIHNAWGTEKCMCFCVIHNTWGAEKRVCFYMIHRTWGAEKRMYFYIIHNTRGADKCMFLYDTQQLWCREMFVFHKIHNS